MTQQIITSEPDSIETVPYVRVQPYDYSNETVSGTEYYEFQIFSESGIPQLTMTERGDPFNTDYLATEVAIDRLQRRNVKGEYALVQIYGSLYPDKSPVKSNSVVWDSRLDKWPGLEAGPSLNDQMEQAKHIASLAEDIYKMIPIATSTPEFIDIIATWLVSNKLEFRPLS